jgi:hypothetical protein
MLALALTLQLAATPHLLDPQDFPNEQAMRQRLDDLTWEAHTLDTSWPMTSLVPMIIGTSFGPAFTLVGALVLAGGLVAIPAIVVAAVIILAVGLAGDGVMIFSLVRGQRAVDDSLARRDALLRERDEVRRMLSGRAASP